MWHFTQIQYVAFSVIYASIIYVHNIFHYGIFTGDCHQLSCIGLFGKFSAQSMYWDAIVILIMHASWFDL